MFDEWNVAGSSTLKDDIVGAVAPIFDAMPYFIV
jgi:hypothetical protein